MLSFKKQMVLLTPTIVNVFLNKYGFWMSASYNSYNMH